MKYNKTLKTPQEIVKFLVNCALDNGMTCNIIKSNTGLKKPFLCIPENGDYLESLN